MRKAAVDLLEDIEIAALALDRIDIGDVKRSKGVQPQQGIYDCLRLRASAKTRLHRSVLRAPALARVHHLPF